MTRQKEIMIYSMSDYSSSDPGGISPGAIAKAVNSHLANGFDIDQIVPLGRDRFIVVYIRLIPAEPYR